MPKAVKLLVGWLLGRQPRIVDYIVIAVIATVLATVIIAAASGRIINGSKSGTPITVAPSTRTVVQTTAATSTPELPRSSPSANRVFYAPGRNISCSLQSESVQCSVASADVTFVLAPGGGGAYTMPGLSVSPAAGQEAPYDTQQSDGVVVCQIPPESVPAGITCRNTASGHGFEASRVASRQSVF